MINLVIKRSEWLRGGKDGLGKEADPSLCNKDGQKCCLGFLAVQCGLKDWNKPFPPTEQEITQEAGEPEDNLDIAWPEALLSEEERDLSDEDGPSYGTVKVNSLIARDLMEENDDTDITETSREAVITRLMAKVGVDVTFVD